MLIPKGALIVSCQARADNPLHGPVFMSAMARAANAGGAAGFRANGVDDVAAIRAISTHPIIGIDKVWDDRFPVYITPSFELAARIAKAGADIIGIDATRRPRNGEPVDRADRPHPRRASARGLRRYLDARRGRGRPRPPARPTSPRPLSGYTEETADREGSWARIWSSFLPCRRHRRRRSWPRVASTRPN